MPIWLRKILVVLITIFTLGYINPSAILPYDSKEPSGSDRVNQNEDNNTDTFTYNENRNNYSENWEKLVQAIPYGERSSVFVDYTIHQATIQATEKFGPKIAERIGDQFQDEILPSLEVALLELSSTIDEEAYRYLVITDQPTAGYGEKIFHIYDGRTKKDLFRFHVRRENPPLDGHWFSFHYHKSDDKYREHHTLGRVYWDKNTPPKWKMYS